MKLPTKDYVLFGCGIAPNDNNSVFAIHDETFLDTFSGLTSVNPQVLPNGYKMTNTQNTKDAKHTLFTDVKVIDKDMNTIIEFSAENLNHECIYGSNSPRYYTPAFDYSTLNSNILCIRNEDVENNSLKDDESVINNIITEYDNTGNIVWSWSVLENFDKFNFTEEEITRYKEENIHLKMFGDGWDFCHLNSVCCLGPNKWYDNGDERFHPENLICCSRNLSLVFVIEKTTGNIIYQLKGTDFDSQYQHYAHIIPRGLPGEGNILLLDSHSKDGGGKNHLGRIYEIDPVTREVVFKYEDSFASNAMGNVQKLEDGCYMIAATHSKKILTVSAEGEVVSTYPLNKLYYRVNLYPANWII